MKRKSKYSVKDFLVTLQIEINPLVNKVGVHKYQKDIPSLIYPMYLNPSNSSYQRASLSHVFTNYPNPTISSKLHPPINGLFQCFPHAPKLLFILRFGEVCVWIKNLSRMYNWRGRSRGKLKRNGVDDCGFTITNSQVYS